MEATLITRHRGDYLWGSFYKEGADGTVDDADPSTGVLLDRIPWRLASVEMAIADAQRASGVWGRGRPADRLALVQEFRELLQARRGALAAMISREMGKPLWEANLECVAAVRGIDLLLEAARPLLLDQVHPSGSGLLRRRPLGVVAVVTPYPYPVYGPIQMLLPALLGGNAVVWKPSSQVPLTSQKLAETFDAARIPNGVLSLVQGPRDPVGQALVGSPDVQMVIAAGRASTADTIRSSTRGARPPWLQSGGKGWALVCADADLDRAAYDVVTGAFLTCGQRSNATSRVLIERPVARDFLKRVVALAAGLTISPPTNDDSFCGPLSDSETKRLFDQAIRRYSRAGVEFALEGGSGQLPARLRRRGQCYVAPAIAVVEGDLPAGAPLPEDVQGPLLVATLVDSAEDAAARYGEHPYGLAAAVFTESDLRFERLAGLLEAGAVNWNRGTIVASARYPNAGLRRSGHGAECNEGLLRACTWPQATLAAAGPFDPSHRVPGMAWPLEMGVVDPTTMRTPPYRPSNDDADVGPADLVRKD
jgi:succinylglutamic semialdehyde dehydrogenase